MHWAVLGEITAGVQHVRFLAQPRLDLGRQVIAGLRRFGKRRKACADLDPGDQRGLLVLRQQTPWRARPIDLFCTQHRDVRQFLSVHPAP
jgi:hypothetical protein